MSFQELIEKEREQRRIYILDAAEALFFEHGFTSVTMEDIAKNVGLNKATIYLYFEDKDSLFFAIVLRKQRIILDTYKTLAQGELSGREKCRRMGKSYFEFARENPSFFRMLCTEGPYRFSNTENAIAKVVIELLGRETGLLKDVLSEGIADGSVRDDLDPLEMAAFISVSLTGIVCLNQSWRHALETGGIGYDRFMADFLAFLDNAIDKRVDGTGAAIQNKSVKKRKRRKRMSVQPEFSTADLSG